ncbi:MAG: multi-sensor signal transduction histidine kinase, partial [Myxococcaceae bacterium]|nr:multi-sensor signal transduction histidine kinase [Myxococcaceae bacterium]
RRPRGAARMIPVPAHSEGLEAERLERLSVLQELTLSALELFDPQYPVDLFLERMAERLSCTAALWLVCKQEQITLLGCAGLSRLSSAHPIASEGLAAPVDWLALPLPYSEIVRPAISRWAFELGSKPGTKTHHGLVLCFDSDARLPPQFRPMVERLTYVLRAALSHRQLLERLDEAQEALLQRERLVALGELSAVVAHEVRNPLGAIFNCLRSLEKLHHPNDTGPILQIVKEEAEQIDRIVGDLLDFAKPRGLLLARASIELVIASGIEAAQRAQPWPFAVSVTLEVESKGATARVDADLLRQAVINLVTNAIQAAGKGGKVVARLRQELTAGRGFIRIDVIDDGPGVSPQARDRIFEPFFSTKASGSGLGLSIVKRIVEAHQGVLIVHSVPQQGSTFSLRFPLEPASP